MARPQKNTVDYFPLYCKEGKSMYYIENKYGNNGYATWIKILSQLAMSEHHYLDLSNKVQFMYLSAKCKVTDIELESIIKDLVLLGEFDAELWNESSVIFSEKFIESIKDAYEKRTNTIICKKSLLVLLDSLGVRKLPKSTPKPHKLPSQGVNNTQTILDNIKGDKTKEYKKSLLSEIIISDFPQLNKKYFESAKHWQKLFKKNLEDAGASTKQIENAKGVWIDDIRLMIETDGYSFEDFREVYDFLCKNSFWKKNILSTSKLREQMAKLKLEIKNPPVAYTKQETGRDESRFGKTSY